MLVHRSAIRPNLSKSPNPYKSSHPPLHPSSSSQHHRHLSTSRKHAHPKAPSTVQLGTSYEHLCARTLPRLGFQDLTRTGGRADRGIDLLGQWLPLSLQRAQSPLLNVVVQCKAAARKAGPDMIRELEGALAGAPGQWSGETTVGVLCARREVTAGVRDALRRSKRGVVWVMVEERDEVKEENTDGRDMEAGEDKEDGEAREGRIKQVLWNDRVQKLVGEVTGTGVIHIPGKDGGRMETEVLMSWNGILGVPEYGQQKLKDDFPDSSHP